MGSDASEVGGSATALDGEALGSGFSGELVVPGHPRYDAVRRGHSQNWDRRPAAIVRCASVADVVAAVGLARRHDLPVAVRSGGCHPAGLSTCDGGIVVDLVGLRDFSLDEGTGVVRVGGGMRNEDAAWGLADTGRAVPTGTSLLVGLGGWTLNGGLGYLTTKVGMGVDNLVAAEVVTLEGEVLQVDERSDPELLWGLRGAGGNFGVVTALELQSHPIAEIVSGMLTYPWSRAREVLRVWGELAAEGLDDSYLDFFCMLWERAPGRPQLELAVTVAQFGSDAEAHLARLRALKPTLDFVRPRAPVHLLRHYQEGLGRATRLDLPMTGARERYSARYWDGEFVAGALSEDVVDVVVEAAEKMWTADVHAPGVVKIFGLSHHGLATRIPSGATAYDLRTPGIFIQFEGDWTDPADARRYETWVDSSADALGAHGVGTYYLNSSSRVRPERVERFFGPANLPRLRRLKARMDPGNVLRFNANVEPEGATA